MLRNQYVAKYPGASAAEQAKVHSNMRSTLKMLTASLSVSQYWYMLANMGFLGAPQAINRSAAFDDRAVSLDDQARVDTGPDLFQRQLQAYVPDDMDEMSRWVLYTLTPHFGSSYTYMCKPGETQKMISYSKCTSDLLMSILRSSHVINPYFFNVLFECAVGCNTGEPDRLIMFTSELKNPAGMVGVPEINITSCAVEAAGGVTNTISDFARASVNMLELQSCPEITSFLTWDSKTRELLGEALPDGHTFPIDALQSVYYNQLNRPRATLSDVFEYMTNSRFEEGAFELYSLVVLCGMAMKAKCSASVLSQLALATRPRDQMLWKALGSIDNSLGAVVNDLNTALMAVNGLNSHDYASIDVTMSQQQAVCKSNWLSLLRLCHRSATEYSTQADFASHFNADGSYITLRL